MLVLFAAFWIAMNVLLWRHEFSGDESGAAIPAEVVFEKILRSPDLSAMEIRQRGKRVGYCRLLANQAEAQATGRVMSETAPLEGEIRRLTGYTLDIDGALYGNSLTNRYRFFVTMQVNTNLDWEVFSLQLTHRPHSVSLSAFATNQTLMATYKDEDFQVQREFTFEQLRNPQRLATDLGGPLIGMLIGGATASLPAGWQDPEELARQIRWKACNDKLKISQGYARVYRLQANLAERRKIVIIVSRVGEILKVELPHGITLVNDEVRI